MKKILMLLMVMLALPAYGDDFGVEYDEYGYAVQTPSRDNYIGFRIHKNERIAFKYDIHDGGNSTIRRDNFGFGALIGNRLSDFAKLEFETSYTGAQQTKRGTSYDFDVWSNMLNFYLFREFADSIAPYVGLGIGFSTIWGDISNPKMSDTVFDLSYSAMVGVNFALNSRVDLNLGVKYQFYGELEHDLNGSEYAITDVDATEFYFGAAYKFGLK